MDLENVLTDRSNLWASPPPPPPALIVVANDVSVTASTPAAEGSRVGRRNPTNGAVSSLVVGGGPIPLVV